MGERANGPWKNKWKHTVQCLCVQKIIKEIKYNTKKEKIKNNINKRTGSGAKKKNVDVGSKHFDRVNARYLQQFRSFAFLMRRAISVRAW